MECPMCGLGEEHQEPDKQYNTKTKCRGCGTIFYNSTRRYK